MIAACALSWQYSEAVYSKYACISCSFRHNVCITVPASSLSDETYQTNPALLADTGTEVDVGVPSPSWFSIWVCREEVVTPLAESVQSCVQFPVGIPRHMVGYYSMSPSGLGVTHCCVGLLFAIHAIQWPSISCVGLVSRVLPADMRTIPVGETS